MPETKYNVNVHYALHNLHVHVFLDHLFVLYDTLYMLGLNVSPNYSPQDSAVPVGHSHYLLLFLKEETNDPCDLEGHFYYFKRCLRS